MEKDYDWYRKNLNFWFFNLDVCVLNALDFLSNNPVKGFDLGDHRRYIGLGSGNAFETSRILLSDKDAIFANESTFDSQLTISNLTKDDCGLLISASGKKDAPIIAERLKQDGLKRKLLTCNSNANPKNYNEVDAMKYFSPEDVYFFEKIPEPYTYNTVTYLGMILSNTKEDPSKIKDHIETRVIPLVGKSFTRHTQYYFLIPKEYDVAKKMFEVKFQELFGRRIGRDFFTPEFASSHATDVVEGYNELFISIGYDNQRFGKERLNIPMPENSDYGAIIAIGYYVIGKIQESLPPYFKFDLVDWCESRGIEPLVR